MIETLKAHPEATLGIVGTVIGTILGAFLTLSLEWFKYRGRIHLHILRSTFFCTHHSELCNYDRADGVRYTLTLRIFNSSSTPKSVAIERADLYILHDRWTAIARWFLNRPLQVRAVLRDNSSFKHYMHPMEPLLVDRLLRITPMDGDDEPKRMAVEVPAKGFRHFVLTGDCESALKAGDGAEIVRKFVGENGRRLRFRLCILSSPNRLTFHRMKPVIEGVTIFPRNKAASAVSD